MCIRDSPGTGPRAGTLSNSTLGQKTRRDWASRRDTLKLHTWPKNASGLGLAPGHSQTPHLAKTRVGTGPRAGTLSNSTLGQKTRRDWASRRDTLKLHTWPKNASGLGLAPGHSQTPHLAKKRVGTGPRAGTLSNSTLGQNTRRDWASRRDTLKLHTWPKNASGLGLAPGHSQTPHLAKKRVGTGPRAGTLSNSTLGQKTRRDWASRRDTLKLHTSPKSASGLRLAPRHSQTPHLAKKRVGTGPRAGTLSNSTLGQKTRRDWASRRDTLKLHTWPKNASGLGLAPGHSQTPHLAKKRVGTWPRAGTLSNSTLGQKTRRDWASRRDTLKLHTWPKHASGLGLAPGHSQTPHLAKKRVGTGPRAGTLSNSTLGQKTRRDWASRRDTLKLHTWPKNASGLGLAPGHSQTPHLAKTRVGTGPRAGTLSNSTLGQKTRRDWASRRDTLKLHTWPKNASGLGLAPGHSQTPHLAKKRVGTGPRAGTLSNSTLGQKNGIGIVPGRPGTGPRDGTLSNSRVTPPYSTLSQKNAPGEELAPGEGLAPGQGHSQPIPISEFPPGEELAAGQGHSQPIC